MWIACVLSIVAQEPSKADLSPRVPRDGESLRWSPKGAKVELESKDGALSGSFALGPEELAPVAVKLERSAGAAHVDVLWLDRDRNGRFEESEKLATEPKETRGKWWSSFTAELAIPVPASEGAQAGSRPYPLDLWFVEDPAEPDAAPALRWSRRGWHEGELAIGGKPAFVLVTEMKMDGVFDQRDSWMLSRERSKLFAAGARSLEGHAWLDGQAYRAVAIDPHGRSLAFEPFDPGITEAEEAAKADVYAPDRAAPRAEKPLAFGKDLAAALAQAKKDGKRVLVDFETTWCGPCATMNQLVYTAKPVVDAAKDVIAVKLDGDEQRELVKKYTVGAYPTILLLASDGKELRRKVGYQGVAAMVEMLKP
jgi:thiol-disulfide isomerase/thioredoxin